MTSTNLTQNINSSQGIQHPLEVVTAATTSSSPQLPALETKIQGSASAESNGSNLKSKLWSWFGKKDVPANQAPVPPSDKKTEEVGASFFSKVKSGIQTAAGKIKQEGYSATLKLAKNIATYGYNPDKTDQESINQLKTLTKSNDLPILINLAAAKIGKIVQQKVETSEKSENIKNFVKEEQALVQQLINSGILNIAVNLAKTENGKKSPEDNTPVQVFDVLESIVKIVKDSLPDYEIKMAEIEAIKDDKQKEAAKKKYLEPAIANIMNLAFPKGADDIVGLNFGKSKLYNFLKDTAIPEVLFELLKGHYNLHSQYEDATKQLKSQLQVLGQKNEDAYKLIDSSCNYLSKTILDKLKQSLSNDAETSSQKLLCEGTSSPQSIAFGKLISTLADDKNQACPSLWNLTQKQIKTLIFKFLGNHLATKEDELDGKRVTEILMHAMSTLAEKLALNNSKADYQALAKELLQQNGMNPREDLPSVFGINTAIAEQLETIILPKLLSSFHEETTVWMNKKEQNKEELKTLFGTTHSQEACKVLGHFVSQFAPWYLSTSNDKAADMILSAISLHIQSQNGTETKELLKEIEAHKPLLKSFLEELIKKMGDTKNPGSSQVWNFVKEYSEAAALEVFVRIAKRINTLEKSFESKDAANLSYHTLVSMLKKAADNIDSLKGSIGEKDGAKTKDFVTLTSQLFSAASLVDGKELPLPSPIKKPAWNLFKTEAMPAVLESIMDTLNEDYTKDALMLGLLKLLSESIADGSIFNGKDEVEEIDLETKALDIECGDVLKRLLTKLPNSTVTELFSNLLDMDFIPSEKIGRIVRGYLKKTNLLQLVDSAIVKIMPYMHQGKWKGEKGERTFEPKKGKFDFELPKTAKEKAVSDAKIKRMKKINHKKLIEEGSEAISSQIATGITGFLKSIWDGFVNGVSKVFSSFRGFIDGIVNNSVVQMIVKGLEFLFKPLFEAGKSLFKSAVISPALRNLSHQSKTHGKDILYSWRDMLFDMIDTSNYETQKSEKEKLKRKLEELASQKKKKENIKIQKLDPITAPSIA